MYVTQDLPTVTVTNLTRGGSLFLVGDDENISISGAPPYSDVYYSDPRMQYGSYVGTTDSSGGLSITNSVSIWDIGAWNSTFWIYEIAAFPNPVIAYVYGSDELSMTNQDSSRYGSDTEYYSGQHYEIDIVGPAGIPVYEYIDSTYMRTMQIGPAGILPVTGTIDEGAGYHTRTYQLGDYLYLSTSMYHVTYLSPCSQNVSLINGPYPVYLNTQNNYEWYWEDNIQWYWIRYTDPLLFPYNPPSYTNGPLQNVFSTSVGYCSIAGGSMANPSLPFGLQINLSQNQLTASFWDSSFGIQPEPLQGLPGWPWSLYTGSLPIYPIELDNYLQIGVNNYYTNTTENANIQIYLRIYEDIY
jgi:hypothetical protein